MTVEIYYNVSVCCSSRRQTRSRGDFSFKLSLSQISSAVFSFFISAKQRVSWSTPSTCTEKSAAVIAVQSTQTESQSTAWCLHWSVEHSVRQMADTKPAGEHVASHVCRNISTTLLQSSDKVWLRLWMVCHWLVDTQRAPLFVVSTLLGSTKT